MLCDPGPGLVDASTREEKDRSLLAIKFALRGKYRRGEGRGLQKEEEGGEPTV